jgi:hypothetical protein
MTFPKDPLDIIDSMADVIVLLTRDIGACTPAHLLKAGFTAQEIDKYYAFAAALAAVVLKHPPKNH